MRKKSDAVLLLARCLNKWEKIATDDKIHVTYELTAITRSLDMYLVFHFSEEEYNKQRIQIMPRMRKLCMYDVKDIGK